MDKDGVKSLETFLLSHFILSLCAREIFQVYQEFYFFSSLIRCFVLEESNCQDHKRAESQDILPMNKSVREGCRKRGKQCCSEGELQGRIERRGV